MSTIGGRAPALFVSCLAVAILAFRADAGLAAGPHSASEEALLEALNLRLDVIFNDMPVINVVELLIHRLPKPNNVSLVIDRRSLAKSDVNLQEKVTVRAKDIHLRSALSLALEQAGAAWTIRNEVLLITTPEIADAQMMARVFDVQDLVMPEEGSGRTPNFQQLVDVIENEIEPKSWDKAGGCGAIQPSTLYGYCLVVRQTPAIQFEVARLLAALRDTPPLSAAERRIQEKLHDSTVLEFVETPLSDVVDYVKDLHGIEIQVDEKALGEAGSGTDTPIVQNLRGIPLASALRLMLEPLGLDFVIKDDVLLVTSKKEADRIGRGKTRRAASDVVLGGLGVRAPVEERLPAAPRKISPEASKAGVSGAQPPSPPPAQEPLEDGSIGAASRPRQ